MAADPPARELDGSIRGSGYALRAVWGSVRFGGGRRGPVSAVYADDEASVWLADADGLFHLDRDGVLLERSDGRHVRLAPRSTPRVALVREGVLVLATGRARAVADEPLLTIADDGSVVASRRRVFGGVDGVLRAELPFDVDSVGPRGLCAFGIERGFRETTLRLARVGATAPVRDEKIYGSVSAFAWSADGERLAWLDHRGRLALWDARDGSSVVLVEQRAREPLHFLGDEVLYVHDAAKRSDGDVRAVSPGRPPRRVAALTRIHSISEDGHRALCAGRPFSELDLETGALHEPPAEAPGIVAVVWHASGEDALALADDGSTWAVDVAHWTLTPGAPPDPRPAALGAHQLVLVPGGEAAMVLVDGVVKGLSRAGRLTFTTTLSRASGARWTGGTLSFAPGRVEVRGKWSRALPPEGDGWVETVAVHTHTELDATTGRALSHRELEDSEPRIAAPSPPSVMELPFDPLLGPLRATWPSPDGRFVLAIADRGRLLRYDRS